MTQKPWEQDAAANPGDPGEDHWARDVYQRLKRDLQGQRGLAPYTVRNYLTDLGAFWRFLDSERVHDLRRVDRGLVRQYLYWLLTEAPPLKGGHGTRPVARPRDRGYADRSVVRKLSALRTLFAFLRRTGQVDVDPTARVASARTSRTLPDFLDPSAVQALLEAPSRATPGGLRDRAILELLYAAGLRVSEVVGVNVDDVDLERREVRVTGKGSHQRLGMLGVPACEAIRVYVETARGRLVGRRDDGALFLNRTGGRLTQRSVQLLVRRYSLQAGLPPGVHPHTLRHTFATHLLDGGADVRVVQHLLGHASPATTQIYTHVTQAGALQTYRSAHPRARRRREEAATEAGEGRG